jgi:SAM-dependent methyltransferase
VGVFRGIHDLRLMANEIRQRGLTKALLNARDALRLRFQIAEDTRFDVAHGVDTSGYILLTGITSANDIRNCSEYHGTPVSVVWRVLSQISDDLSDYTFIDYGSGKGRILLLASRLPFKRVVGIEFMDSFHEVAVANISAYQDPAQRCRDVQSICIDARDYDLPDTKCVLYFYRPFTGSVLKAVIDRIEASWRAHPRSMYLIFVCPFSTDPFRDLAFVEKLKVPIPLLARVMPEGYGTVLYRTRETASVADERLPRSYATS